MLSEAGARVRIADIAEDHVSKLAEETGAEISSVNDILFEEVDVLSPCALGGILNPDTLPKLKCKIVAGAANNQLSTPEMGDELAKRGILYAPDYVINGGGIINVAAEISGSYRPEWVAEKLDTLMETLRDIFQRADSLGRATNRVADDIATERIQAAKRANI